MYFIQEGIVDIIMNNGEVTGPFFHLPGCYLPERRVLLWGDLPADQRPEGGQRQGGDLLQRLLPLRGPLQHGAGDLPTHEANHGERGGREVSPRTGLVRSSLTLNN